jgi:hypothetical protein
MLGSSLSSSDPSSKSGSRPGWSGLASTAPRAASRLVSRHSPRPRSRQSEPSWRAEPASSRPLGCVGPALARCTDQASTRSVRGPGRGSRIGA